MAISKGAIAGAAGVIAFAALALLLMGRIPFCECGTVKLWGGIELSPEMSQQFADIYSPSHFLHGIGFFWLLWLIRKKVPMSLGMMLVIATAVEAGWEIIENTDLIINRYREVTISFDYYGDSVFNSIGDILFMIFGFLYAARLPGWASLGIALILELGVVWLIRDNLTLNIIMLLYPIDAIRMWQGGF